MNKIKIAFLGNPDISVRALNTLYLSNKFEIALVITNKSKTMGRGNKIADMEVSKYAKKNNLKLLETNNINLEYYQLKNNYEFDYLITCAFGQFLSKEILSVPKKVALNIHASLLPKGRGGAPIHRAIINGENESGYSLMEMVYEMDAGGYYIQHNVNIDKSDTYDNLKEKISILIEENLVNDLLNLDQDKLIKIQQDKEKVTYWLNIKPTEEKINFNNPGEKIVNKIRGLNSIPGAYSMVNNMKIKIWQAEFNEKENLDFKNGEILEISKKGIEVKCNNGIILITQITIPGKKKNEVKNIISGNLPFKKGNAFE